jgi:uncharacterized protein (DUF1330 family)
MLVARAGYPNRLALIERIDMSVYMIIDSKVKDKDKYRQYIEQVSPIVIKFGGRYHVCGENIRAFGSWKPERIVVIEFPTENHVQDWLSSAEYKAIAPLREDGADTQAILVDGYAHE